MSAIIKVVKGICNGIISIVDFIKWIVQEIIDLTILVVSALQNVITLINQIIPAPLLALCLAIVTIAVIYKILGREG